MRGGPRVFSPAMGWGRKQIEAAGEGSVRSRIAGAAVKARGASTGCLRLTRNSLARKGASTGVAFCSGRTRSARWRHAPSVKDWPPEGDRPICCASQTAKLTVNATANPVHLLARSWVALGFANCTAGVKHALCQGVSWQITPYLRSRSGDFRNCHAGVDRAMTIQVWLFLAGPVDERIGFAHLFIRLRDL